MASRQPMTRLSLDEADACVSIHAAAGLVPVRACALGGSAPHAPCPDAAPPWPACTRRSPIAQVPALPRWYGYRREWGCGTARRQPTAKGSGAYAVAARL